MPRCLGFQLHFLLPTAFSCWHARCFVATVIPCFACDLPHQTSVYCYNSTCRCVHIAYNLYSFEMLGAFLKQASCRTSLLNATITESIKDVFFAPLRKLHDDPKCPISPLQVAEALRHLPNIGYVSVLKVADGSNRTYTVSGNGSSANNTSWTADGAATFLVWEWEVTFVSNAGDLPLLAAVWSDGRTLPGEGEGFGARGRAGRLICGSCQMFPSDSWPSTAEATVGLRMEVNP